MRGNSFLRFESQSFRMLQVRQRKTQAVRIIDEEEDPADLEAGLGDKEKEDLRKSAKYVFGCLDCEGGQVCNK